MLEDENGPPVTLIGISGEIRLWVEGLSHPVEIVSDNMPSCSFPKDNRVGGVTLVAGSSLSSGTTGVDVDISIDDENEFFANNR